MPETTKHTPTPWAFDRYFALVGPDGSVVAIPLGETLEEARGNGEFIMLACNAHQDLLDALKLAQTFIAEELACREQSMLPASDHDDGIYVTAAQNALKVVTAAITKGEGRDA